MIHPDRNDPCLCGSGKKYKKCCLRSVDANEFEYRRQRQVEAGLIPRLLDYADETFGPVSVAAAWREFNDFEPVEDLDPEAPMNMVFKPWYIFNWIHDVKSTGKQGCETTIAESFSKKLELSLATDEKAFLLSAIRCQYSLCEIVEVKPGVGMKLVDMFRRLESCTEGKNHDWSRLWDADAAHEVKEARVGAQGIESWIHLEANDHELACLIGLFEPRESLIFVTQSDIYQRDRSWGHETLLR